MRVVRSKGKTTKKARPKSSVLEPRTVLSSGMIEGGPVEIPTLTFLSGDALGRELPLVQDEMTIGRGPEADVLVLDPSVSRRHLKLSCRRVLDKSSRPSLKVILQDLGSRNGTLVNYEKVDRILLKPGDKIILGKIVLKFEHRDIADQKFYDEVFRLVSIDPLTAHLNKVSIARVLLNEIEKQERYPSHLSVLLLDIDDFKTVNDTYGHLIGDRALQSVGAVLGRNLRKQDRAGRFGGEEFLVVLSETPFDGAMILAERLRHDIEDTVGAEIKIDRKVTGSIGVATYPDCGTSADALLGHADQALYEAKRLGKNRVCYWQAGETPVPV